MNSSIFGGYDIRGTYPEEINEDLAYAVGRAVARLLSAKTIVVGRDARESSPALAEKLIEGISCEGADVIDIGLVPTPVVSFGVLAYGYDAGVMISASHSPASYNAFKILRPGKNKIINQVDKETGLVEIENLIKKGFASCPGKGAVIKKDVLSDYLAHVLKGTEEITGLKTVVDYGNGVGAITAKPALARLDIESVGLFEEPDGSFPNHEANPHNSENFKDLEKRVVAEKADLGIFFDGDADRAWFVDEKGMVVPNDLAAALLAKEEIKKNNGGKVYYDLRFTKAFPEIIKEHGGEPVMLAVGNPLYKKYLSEEGGVLGAEFAGHFMFPENWGVDDGLFASLRLMTILSKEEKPFSELIAAINKYEDSEEVSLPAKNPDTVYDRLISEYHDAELIEIDGVYFDFPDGFISVRRSKNERELFRVRVEATTKETLKERFERALEIIKS